MYDLYNNRIYIYVSVASTSTIVCKSVLETGRK